jgi:hypothetical protein
VGHLLQFRHRGQLLVLHHVRPDPWLATIIIMCHRRTLLCCVTVCYGWYFPPVNICFYSANEPRRSE